MILGFELFHPLRGQLTSEFKEFCGDIVYRARALLNGRSEEEIFAAIEIINWMIDQSPPPSREKDEVYIKINSVFNKDEHGNRIKLDGDPNDWLTRRNVYSATYVLKERQLKYDITENETFPNATWDEFFAVMALGLVDQASFYYTFTNGPYKNSQANALYREIGNCARTSEYLMDAMDAVATAEGIQHLDSSMADAKQKIKTRNKSAAIRRHAKTNEAILTLNSFYDEDKHKSMRNSALLFCDAFPAKVEHLAHYNRVRTLTEGLSSYRKARRPSLQQ